MFVVCFFKQKTASEMRISDWSSDVCSSDLLFLRLLNVVTLSLATFWFLLFHVRVGDRVLAVTNPPSVPPLLALVLRLRRARSVLLVQIGRASCRERVCQYV